MNPHGLNPQYLHVIRHILQPYAQKIDVVGLFGSRAQGTYKENSDIDIVLYGDLTEGDMNRIYSLFDECLLPVSVDVKAYHLLDYPPLKKHIDTVMHVIFTREDL